MRDTARGPTRVTASACAGARRHAVGRQRAEQLAQQQRIAAGGAQARVRERGVGVGPQAPGDQPGHAVRVSGEGLMWTASGWETTSPSITGSVPGSAVRRPTTSVAVSPSSRRDR